MSTRCDDPEIDFGEMRIGAKVIAHHHRTFSFQLGQRPIHLILTDVESPQPSHQLGRKARLLATNVENIDDGILRTGLSAFVRSFIV